LRAILICAAVAVSVSAQNNFQSQQVTELDDLINRGEYEHGTKLAQLLLQQQQAWGPNKESIFVLTHIGSAQVELGRISDAVKVISQADTLAPTIPNNLYEIGLLRATAVLQLEVGQYQAAASLAAKAVKLALDRNLESLRVGYYRSIQAMALLRLGNPSDAELIVLKAVKDCPKKPGKYFVFAPRILYTACLVESYQQNFALAEEYCRRGLEIAQAWKKETRDLSLGYLAQAEASLEAGDLARSREAAAKTVEITTRLFGDQHQDIVQALGLLARINAKQGNMPDACAQANRAVKIAISLFGPVSSGAGIPTRALQRMSGCLAAPK